MRHGGAQYASSKGLGLNITAGPAIMPGARVAAVDARRIPGDVE
jgi:hypothetical protein